jgi:hypothetical protein
VLQGGDCAETFEGATADAVRGQAADAAADGAGADLRGERARWSRSPDGRPVRQAAVPPRPRSARASSCPPTAATRSTASSSPRRPGRPTRAGCSRLPLLRGHAQPVPGLHHRRLRGPAPGARLEPGLRPAQPVRAAVRAAGRRDRPRPGVHAGLRRRPGELRSVELYSSHEALLLDYEQALTRTDSRTPAYGTTHRRTSCGSASAPARWRRARRVRPRHPQPHRGQARARCHPRRRPRAAAALNPDGSPGGSRSSPGWAPAGSARLLPPLVRGGHRQPGPGRLGLRSDARQHLRGAQRPQDQAVRRRAGRGARVLRGAPGSAPIPAASTSSSPATT